MATKAPTISVVVPAFNAERFIERTLRSALAQREVDLEVVIVDDGSTDGTRAIVDRFAAADPRVRVVSVSNGGVARARNLGIEMACGEFVALLDADDIWHPDKLTLQLAALLPRDQTWAACYAFSRAIDVEDRVLSTQRRRWATGFILTRHMYGKFVGNGSSLLVRRSAALAVGGFDPSYADANIGGCEDLDFELRLAARYRIDAIPSYLVGYRYSDGNMSSNHLRMSRSMVETIGRHLECNPEIPVTARRLIWASTYAWASLILRRDRKWLHAAWRWIDIFKNDPAIAFANLGQQVKEIVRRFIRKLTRHPAGHRVAFEQLDPLDGAGSVPAIDRRLGSLAAVDEAIERARLPKLSGRATGLIPSDLKGQL